MGGTNMSPAEVEMALVELAGVREAFVFGIPAADRGDDVAPVVVLDGPEAVESSSLRVSLRETLSS